LLLLCELLAALQVQLLRVLLRRRLLLLRRCCSGSGALQVRLLRRDCGLRSLFKLLSA
jgi:hypothetical protein